MPVCNEYEVVRAKSPIEAIEKSPFFFGQKASVAQIEVIANSDGTWSVFAKFKLEERK